MYRVGKILNNNGVIAINMDDNQEYVLLGKGIGFGKKVSQRFEKPEGTARYRLAQDTERGTARSLVQGMDPCFLEIADEILGEAERMFGSVDRKILFTLADHISFAVSRIRKNEPISNPLTDDIKALFYNEFKAASRLKEILKEKLSVDIDDHEIGYVALHIHSAIEDENVSVAMQTARAVHICIGMIEEMTGEKIDVISLSYNRLMNHIKYMVTRCLTGEKVRLNMNDYMEIKFPKSYEISKKVCEEFGKSIGITIDEVETGYLAMHIERVYQLENIEIK